MQTIDWIVPSNVPGFATLGTLAPSVEAPPADDAGGDGKGAENGEAQSGAEKNP